jgi:hypothetical protein
MAAPNDPRPSADDVRDFLGAQPGGPINMEEIDRSLASARERILERLVDFDDQMPENVVRAITMQAARLYRRRFSVGGYEGFGDVGIARVPVLDADIEDLLTVHFRYGFA